MVKRNSLVKLNHKGNRQSDTTRGHQPTVRSGYCQSCDGPERSEKVGLNGKDGVREEVDYRYPPHLKTQLFPSILYHEKSLKNVSRTRVRRAGAGQLEAAKPIGKSISSFCRAILFLWVIPFIVFLSDIPGPTWIYIFFSLQSLRETLDNILCLFCIFTGCSLNISDSGLSLFSLGVSVCTTEKSQHFK